MTSLADRLLNAAMPLSEGASVEQVTIGSHMAGVVVSMPSGQQAGVAATLSSGAAGDAERVAKGDAIAKRSLTDVMALIGSQDTEEAAVGLAAINAVIGVPLEYCVEQNAQDVIMDEGAGKHVAIVGHFPFTQAVREVAGRLDVLELHPRPGDLPAEMAPEVLPKADVIALTGTTILNHTFDDLIALCRPEALVVMLGGSTPMTPLLFDNGVDVISGTKITDSSAALRAIAEGVHYRHMPGKRLLTMRR